MVARYGWILQERLTRKDQKISENFFARGDGTVCPLPHELWYIFSLLLYRWLRLWSSWEFPAAWWMMLVLLIFGDYLLVGDFLIYFNTAACVLFFRAFSFGFIRGTRVHLQGSYSALPSNWESLLCPCYESVGNPDYNSFWTFHMNCCSRELKDFEDFIASQIVVQQDSLTGFGV